MNTKSIFWAMALLPLLFATSCSEDDDNVPEQPENEEELITTVVLTFTSGSDNVTATWQDLDGPGGNNPIVDSLNLDTNATYSVKVQFLNEQENPAEDITTEVLEEGVEHQVFFLADASLPINVSYNDSDDNGNPIGLSNNANTAGSGSGNLEVILRHKPDKNAAGVSDGLIENAGGETDVQVQFPVIITE